MPPNESPLSIRRSSRLQAIQETKISHVTPSLNSTRKEAKPVEKGQTPKTAVKLTHKEAKPVEKEQTPKTAVKLTHKEVKPAEKGQTPKASIARPISSRRTTMKVPPVVLPNTGEKIVEDLQKIDAGDHAHVSNRRRTTRAALSRAVSPVQQKTQPTVSPQKSKSKASAKKDNQSLSPTIILITDTAFSSNDESPPTGNILPKNSSPIFLERKSKPAAVKSNLNDKKPIEVVEKELMAEFVKLNKFSNDINNKCNHFFEHFYNPEIKRGAILEAAKQVMDTAQDASLLMCSVIRDCEEKLVCLQKALKDDQ